MSRGPLLRRILRWAVLGLGGLGAVLLIVLALGPTVKLGFLEARFERALSDVLGVDASIDSFAVTIGFRAGAQVQGLRLGEPAAEVLRVEHARVHLALLQLLRKRLDVRLVEVEGVRTSADRWSSLEIASPDGDRAEIETDWAFLGVNRLALRDLTLEATRGPGEERILLHVGSAKARATVEAPIELSVEGVLDSTPFAMSLTSGVPQSLIDSRVVPMQGNVSVGELDLDFGGRLDLTTTPGSLSADVELSAPSLASVGQLVQADLPEISPLRGTGRFELRDAAVLLRKLELTLGASTTRGELEIDLAAQVPSLEGHLTVDALDLSPWMGPEPLTLDDILAANLGGIPTALAAVEADLSLKAARVEGLPLDLTEIELSPGLSEGRLTLPMTGRMDSSSFSGTLVLHGTEKGLATDVELQLLDLRAATPDGIEKSAQRTRVAARGAGMDGAGLLSSMELDVTAQGLVLDYLGNGGEVIGARADRAEARWRGSRLSARAEGSLAEAPLEIEASLDMPEGLRRDRPWRFEASGRGRSGEFEIAGEIVPRLDDPTSASQFSARGALPLDSPVEFALRGSQRLTSGILYLALDEGRIGNSDVTAELTTGEIPHLRLHSSSLDLVQLKTLLPDDEEAIAGDGEIDLDLPILPAGLEMRDADLDIAIDRLDRGVSAWEDVQASLRIRDGRLLPSKFGFRDGPTPLSGSLSFDLRGAEPTSRLELSAQDVDLGALLERNGVALGLEGGSRNLELTLIGRGSTPRELLSRSELDLTAEDVNLKLVDATTGKSLELALETVNWQTLLGQPAILDLAGTIRGRPLGLRLEIRNWDDRVSGTPLPVRLVADIGATSLRVETEAELPLRPFEQRHRITLQGTDLFELLQQQGGGRLKTASFELEAVLQASPESLVLDRFQLVTGSSSLEGSGLLRKTKDAPEIELFLTSDRIELNDFLSADIGSEVEQAIVERAPGPAPEEAADPEGPSAGNESLRSGKATIEVTLNRIDLAGENLGDGLFSLSLADGRLVVDGEAAFLNGGTVVLDLQVDATGEQLDGELRSRFEQIDLADIVERLEMEEFSGGRLTLDIGASFVGSGTREALAVASGHLDATYYPKDADSRILDLWAGPLLRAAAPAKEERSGINCFVAWLTLEDGMLSPDALFIDTGKMRAFGKGSIDLTTGELDLRLSPRPKSRNLLSLATPVRVAGTWEDPSIRPVRGGVLGTLVKIQLWAITVWRDLARRPLPPDGSDICLDPPPRATLPAPEPASQ